MTALDGVYMKDIVKICKVHGELTADQVQPTFNKTKTNKFPYSHAHCRECRNAKMRNWKSRNPINVRNQNRYTRFRLRPHEFENLVSEQGNKCAICFEPETAINSYIKGIDSLSVDHCHKTGKIRELLCKKCNALIGMSRESIEILQSAIDYIRRHNK